MLVGGTHPSIHSFNNTVSSKIYLPSYEKELFSLVHYLKTKINFIVNTKKVKIVFIH